MNTFSDIRKAEAESHTQIYSTANLFDEGSWLHKPVKTVMDTLPLLSHNTEIQVLDLGCGIGRNCIPIAKTFKNQNCCIDCVDILEIAIQKLNENAAIHSVKNSINSFTTAIENFEIKESCYDLILSVSSLEHIDNETNFTDKLIEIKKGLKNNGIVCLIINSKISEKDKSTGFALQPQFEVNIPTDKLVSTLNSIFNNFKILKQSIITQNYDIPRENVISALTSNVVTFVAQNICP